MIHGEITITRYYIFFSEDEMGLYSLLIVIESVKVRKHKPVIDF